MTACAGHHQKDGPKAPRATPWRIFRVVRYRGSRSGCGFGAGGGTRTPTGLPPTDFRTNYGFRRPAAARSRFGAFVVWTIPSPCSGPRIAPGHAPGVRCCPSSLYTFPFPGLARDCRREVSPSLGSSASVVSRGALKCSSPLRPPFRHARVAAKAIPTLPGVAKATGLAKPSKNPAADLIRGENRPARRPRSAHVMTIRRKVIAL